ncbi:MAG TPA: IS630 family transposase [Gemmataceae bacterium]|nr:IS630 family transposase [Gemmataceae bacterium]
MPGSAAKLQITERQQAVLRQIVAAPTSPVRLAQRAEIILRAFAKEENQAIAAAVGLDPTAVGLWRRRWVQAWPKLIRIECTESHAAFRRAIADVLADRPRSGNPGKFTPEQVTQILALACEPPEQSGRPITHWTYKELADEAKKRGIVASISEAQVGRYLREAELQPHKSRYWLNAREKDPQQFQEKVEAVCACYLAAPRLYQEEHTHTVCTDEMTGIQALERVAATLPMRPGQAECREFEYKRHGTTTLIGNFHVVTGQLLAPSLGPTRTEADFVRHVAQTVATDPAAAWVFVVDNLNIHASEGLVQWVAKACGIEQDLGKKRQTRRAPLASHAAGVPERARPPRPLRVLAEAHFVAEPD